MSVECLCVCGVCVSVEYVCVAYFFALRSTGKARETPSDDEGPETRVKNIPEREENRELCVIARSFPPVCPAGRE